MRSFKIQDQELLTRRISNLWQGSFALVELAVHQLYRLHQLLWLLWLDPLSELPETEHFARLDLFACWYFFLAEILKVDENSLVVLVVENPVYHMANEQFQLQLASYVDVFSDVLVGLGKHVPDYQPIRLLEFVEWPCLRVEHSSLELRNRYLPYVHTHQIRILI